MLNSLAGAVAARHDFGHSGLLFDESTIIAAESSPYPAQIGRLAIRSLYREAALAPKPGLVSPESAGSHSDMDFATFMRSLNALRSYFPAIADCGLSAAPVMVAPEADCRHSPLVPASLAAGLASGCSMTIFALFARAPARTFSSSRRASWRECEARAA
jgi:hypothetical protein